MLVQYRDSAHPGCLQHSPIPCDPCSPMQSNPCCCRRELEALGLLPPALRGKASRGSGPTPLAGGASQGPGLAAPHPVPSQQQPAIAVSTLRGQGGGRGLRGTQQQPGSARAQASSRVRARARQPGAPAGDLGHDGLLFSQGRRCQKRRGPGELCAVWAGPGGEGARRSPLLTGCPGPFVVLARLGVGWFVGDWKL